MQMTIKGWKVFNLTYNLYANPLQVTHLSIYNFFGLVQITTHFQSFRPIYCFRWVCTSCDPADLELTDAIACHVQEELASEEKWEKRAQQYRDNIKWIKEAGANQMVCCHTSLNHTGYRESNAIVSVFREWNVRHHVVMHCLVDSALGLESGVGG